MTQPLVEDLQKLEANGIVAYDAFLKEPVLLIAPVICMIGDNPRQSEIMNHAGTNAKMFCRMCMVSFIANDLSFILTMQAMTGNCGSEIATLRTKTQTLKAIEDIGKKSTGREKAQLKTMVGVNTSPNPLLQLPIDFHR